MYVKKELALSKVLYGASPSSAQIHSSDLKNRKNIKRYFSYTYPLQEWRQSKIN